MLILLEMKACRSRYKKNKLSKNIFSKKSIKGFIYIYHFVKIKDMSNLLLCLNYFNAHETLTPIYCLQGYRKVQ